MWIDVILMAMGVISLICTIIQLGWMGVWYDNHLNPTKLHPHNRPDIPKIVKRELQALSKMCWTNLYVQGAQLAAAAFYLYHAQWGWFCGYAAIAALGLFVNQVALNKHRALWPQFKHFPSIRGTKP